MTAPIHELVLELILDAPKEKLYRGWTEPELMKQWFAPKPWTTSHAETDVRPGGASLVVMRSPEGQDYPNPGQYLDCLLYTSLKRNAILPERWALKACRRTGTRTGFHHARRRFCA